MEIKLNHIQYLLDELEATLQKGQEQFEHANARFRDLQLQAPAVNVSACDLNITKINELIAREGSGQIPPPGWWIFLLFCIFGIAGLLTLRSLRVKRDALQRERIDMIKELYDTPSSRLREKVQEIFENEFGAESEEERVGLVSDGDRNLEMRETGSIVGEGWEAASERRGMRVPPPPYARQEESVDIDRHASS